MGVGPKARITGPVPVPPITSLFTAIEPTREDDERWAAGVLFERERCSNGDVFDPCGVVAKTLDVGDNEPIGESETFGVWAGAICTTRDSDHDTLAKARRALAACDSKLVAGELASGTLAVASDWPNFYLEQPGATVLSAAAGVEPVDALACLEAALGECSCSGVGVIHATRQVATYWFNAQLLEVEVLDGGRRRYRTHLGTIVAVDGGYTGDAPDGVVDAAGVVWAFATGPVQLRLSDPRPVGMRDVEIVDRAANVRAGIFERAVNVVVDECCHAAVGVQVTSCLNLLEAS